jgi:hypothetical protein
MVMVVPFKPKPMVILSVGKGMGCYDTFITTIFYSLVVTVLIIS